jgi:hypothetical protein
VLIPAILLPLLFYLFLAFKTVFSSQISLFCHFGSSLPVFPTPSSLVLSFGCPLVKQSFFAVSYVTEKKKEKADSIMSKYSALFNSQFASGSSSSSGGGGGASDDAVYTAQSSPSVPSTDSTPTSSSSLSSPPSPPRSRLVRRRRDATSASSDTSNHDNRSGNSMMDSCGGVGEEGRASHPSTATTEAPLSTPPLPLIDDAGVTVQLHPFPPPTKEEDEGVQADDHETTENEKRALLDDANQHSETDLHDGSNESNASENTSINDCDPAGLESTSSNAAATPSSLPKGPVSLYTCDACMHFITSSYRDLEQHALAQHGDALADYTRLRSVAEKLVPVWSQVVKRKRSAIQRCGEEVFRVAVQRDAGAAKMAEAHRARAQLELVVQRWHPTARVFIFGSSVAFGVWDGMSDIDFTVVDVDELEAGLWPPSEKNAVRTITELLRRAGFSFINLEPISHARVPIIKHHASLPIRLTDEQRRRLREEAQQAAAAASVTNDTDATTQESSSTVTGKAESEKAPEDEENTQLEAELVIARSVRYTLNLPATALDSAVLEASIRLAVGTAAVQQVWWNRSREMCCVTFDTTTNAIKGATCPLHFVSAGMRARVQPLHEECRPELYGMDFDLSFRAFGIRNSHLLRRYLLSHPCARPGALVLKDWSKSSGVNNSVNGYLTSYAINIMWIYYLVHHHYIPYVSPTEDIPASLRGNVSGDPEYAAMVDPAWTAEQRAAMETQAGELLLGFFYYYAFDFDWEHHVVSLNRPGVTTKASLGWDVEDVGVAMPMDGRAGSGGSGHRSLLSAPNNKSNGVCHQHHPLQPHQSDALSSGATSRRSRGTTRYSFCIEDPYEENLNLGRHMGVTKTLRVQTELYRGLLSLLKDDVHHCCVFAGTSSAAEKKSASLQDSSGGSAGCGGTRSTTEPSELPLRVLYRLMAISTRELALARATHSSQQPKSVFTGVPLEKLTAAFAARAPAEWKVATSAWNVQQLLHRLGLKLHGGVYVLPRREVGVRRLVAQTPPSGVVSAMAPEPTVGAAKVLSMAGSTSSVFADGGVAASSCSAEGAATPMTTEQLAQMNRRLLQPVGTRYLSNDLMMAVTRGYECLTPQWVAWSKPWAALSAWWTDRRQQTLAASGAKGTATDTSGASVTTTPSSAASTAPAPLHVSALPEQAVGVLHQTRKQLTFPFFPIQRGLRCLDAASSPTRQGSQRMFLSEVGRRAPAACLPAAAAAPPKYFRRLWRLLLR